MQSARSHLAVSPVGIRVVVGALRLMERSLQIEAPGTEKREISRDAPPRIRSRGARPGQELPGSFDGEGVRG
jgi:hypothetical protein